MKENFNIIIQAFEKAGIDIPTVEYSITPYSLNTELSFRFGNLEQFLLFLNLKAPDDDEKISIINTMMIEEGIEPNKFFYVNFYRPKVAEL
ncbi:hypothetical protein D3C87_340350 [compost metagenome]